MGPCGNRSGRDKEKRLFRLPTVSVDREEQTLELSKPRQDIWLARIKREDLEPSRYNNVRVCSDHFVSGEPAKLYEEKKNHVDWAPSLRLGYYSNQLEKSQCCSTQERSTRLTQRNSRKRMASEVFTDATDDASSETVTQTCLNDVVSGTATRTCLNIQDLDAAECEIAELKDEVTCLKTELKVMSTKLKNVEGNDIEVKRLKEEVTDLVMDESTFTNNDDKVVYYTGLTNWEITEIVSPYQAFNTKEISFDSISAITGDTYEITAQSYLSRTRVSV